MKKLLLSIALLILLNGCSHVISRTNLEKIDRSVSLEQLMKAPEKYVGKIVLLGGEIVNAVNRKEGTYLEVLQKEVDSYGRPLESDKTRGRFLIIYEGYLDSAIFSRGRPLTVAGEVRGVKKQPLGEIEYKYPLIKALEMHLLDYRRGPAIRFGIGIGGTF